MYIPSMSIHNEHWTAPAGFLLRLFKWAFKRGYEVVPCLGVDQIDTRAQRTRKGAVEVGIYGDGSGFEVAFLGRVFMLGIEAQGS